jgi:thioredoxin reductase (NADPH)
MSNIETHDLIVIGGGPAGLAAAITAESQGFDTLVLDNDGRLGGQASTALLIENYPGFPGGVSGRELTERMVDQALHFTTEFVAPAEVDEIESHEDGLLIRTDDQTRYIGKAALLSTGVEQRRLPARNLAAYLGRGAVYGSPQRALAEEYRDKELYIIGGSDAAGQAANAFAFVG